MFYSPRLLIIGIELSILLLMLSLLGLKHLEPNKFAPIVKIHSGFVRGIVQPAGHGLDVHFYEGIRFGQAKRFQKPILAEQWIGIYEATTPRPACPMWGMDRPHRKYLTKEYIEDCLFLNVWVPAKPQSRPIAVMIYIYGGKFQSGTIFNVLHDARYLAARGEVIVVAMDYRMGALGFLYTGHSKHDVPGNLGLDDMILALSWVQLNIHKFGGNPRKVTIFGNSSGSISVSALVLSPATRGLFARAILQSGSPLEKSLHSTEEALQSTIALANELNCPASGPELVSCLMGKSIEEILNSTRAADVEFRPIYHDRRLLPIHPVKALKTGKFFSNIDLMFGVVQDEGAPFAIGDLPELAQPDVNFDLNLTKASIRKLFHDKPFSGEVVEYYTGNLSENSIFTQDQLKSLISTAYGDYKFTCQVILFGQQVARWAPSSRRFYAWRLTQRAGIPVMSTCANQSWTGVCHADELFFLYGIPDQVTSEERNLSANMIRAWSQFAKSGNAGQMDGIKWEEAFDWWSDTKQTRHMQLHSGNYSMVEGFFHDVCDQFWAPIMLG